MYSPLMHFIVSPKQPQAHSNWPTNFLIFKTYQIFTTEHYDPIVSVYSFCFGLICLQTGNATFELSNNDIF